MKDKIGYLSYLKTIAHREYLGNPEVPEVPEVPEEINSNVDQIKYK